MDVTVTGPYYEPVQAYYGYLRESNTAVMEMATAAGITLSDKKDPMTATTCGVGELILHAISRVSAISLSVLVEVPLMTAEWVC